MLLLCLSGSFTRRRKPGFLGCCPDAAHVSLGRDAPEELWDQLGCAGTEPLPASDGMLSGLLRIEMLPSVTCKPFALQSCCLSRLKERNFSCFV